MNSRKWNPNNPRCRVRACEAERATAHAQQAGQSADRERGAVSRNGGRCESDAPSAASVPTGDGAERGVEGKPGMERVKESNLVVGGPRSTIELHPRRADGTAAGQRQASAPDTGDFARRSRPSATRAIASSAASTEGTTSTPSTAGAPRRATRPCRRASRAPFRQRAVASAHGDTSEARARSRRCAQCPAPSRSAR